VRLPGRSLRARNNRESLRYIGVLVSASPPHPFADAFWRGLHTLGYSEGQNIKVDFRYTDARSDRAEDFAEEFVRLNVDVIVAHFPIGLIAPMQATRTIAIVMAPDGAPLQLGVIDTGGGGDAAEDLGISRLKVGINL
jgi:putative ABC transport system substrate-binding protein